MYWLGLEKFHSNDFELQIEERVIPYIKFNLYYLICELCVLRENVNEFMPYP